MQATNEDLIAGTVSTEVLLDVSAPVLSTPASALKEDAAVQTSADVGEEGPGHVVTPDVLPEDISVSACLYFRDCHRCCWFLG